MFDGSSILLPQISPDAQDLAAGLVFACPSFFSAWMSSPKELTGRCNNLTQQTALDRAAVGPRGSIMWRTGDANASKYLKASQLRTHLQFRDHLTISIWFIVLSTNASGGYLFNYRTGASEFGFHFITDLPSSGNISMYTTANNSTFQIASGNYTLGRLHHAVGVFIPSTAVQLYLDGVLKHNYTTSIPSQRVTTPNATVNIGGPDTGGTTYLFNGYASEPLVWNRALNRAEVRQLYEDPQCLFRHQLVFGKAPTVSANLLLHSGMTGNMIPSFNGGMSG